MFTFTMWTYKCTQWNEMKWNKIRIQAIKLSSWQASNFFTFRYRNVFVLVDSLGRRNVYEFDTCHESVFYDLYFIVFYWVSLLVDIVKPSSYFPFREPHTSLKANVLKRYSSSSRRTIFVIPSAGYRALPKLWHCGHIRGTSSFFRKTGTSVILKLQLNKEERKIEVWRDKIYEIRRYIGHFPSSQFLLKATF
jgi:hypothetical protein